MILWILGGNLLEEKMINKYYILEQLYIKTQKERTLECTDLLGNITKCTFQWNQPICKEQLKILKNKFNLRLPEYYEKFLPVRLDFITIPQN